MHLQTPFNPQDFDPTQVVTEQLPVSDEKGHAVIIIKSEQVATKDNSGWFLALELKVVEGPHAGRTGIHRLNLANANQQAVEIAHRQLSAICFAIGYLGQVQQTEILHNKPFRVVVALQDSADGREKGYTQVTRILDAQGNMPKRGGAAPTQPNQPQQYQQVQQQAPVQIQPQSIGTPQPGQQWGPPQGAPQQQQWAQPPQQQQWGPPAQQPMQQAPQQQYQPPAQNPNAAPWSNPPQGNPGHVPF